MMKKYEEIISVEELHQIAHSDNITKIRLIGASTIQDIFYDQWTVEFRNCKSSTYFVPR